MNTDKRLTLSTPDMVIQFPGPSLSKLMAQFRFGFWFSYWCMLSPQQHQHRSRAWTYGCYVTNDSHGQRMNKLFLNNSCQPFVADFAVEW